LSKSDPDHSVKTELLSNRGLDPLSPFPVSAEGYTHALYAAAVFVADTQQCQLLIGVFVVVSGEAVIPSASGSFVY